MMDIPALLAGVGLPDAEVVGTKGKKSVVRVYTEAKGWCYAKIGKHEHEDVLDQQSLANFAGTVKLKPATSRANLKVGK